jgi:hypothetical protein
MTNERSIDELMNEFNDQAKAEGRYDSRAFWEVPPQPGSILDVPLTPEAEERIARLRARRLGRLKAAQEPAMSVQNIQQDARNAAQARLPKEKTPAE